MRQSKRSIVNGPGRNKGAPQDWEGAARPATVWLGESMLGMLKAHAQATQRSFSDVIREACRQYLTANSNTVRKLVEGEK